MNLLTQPAPASALIDGEAKRCVDFADRGLQYGDGIFSTLPLVAGFPLLLGRHLDRLQRDAGRLKIPFPDRSNLLQEALRLASFNPEGVLKILLTRGVGGRGYRLPQRGETTRILSVHPRPGYPDETRTRGVRVRWCELRLGINPRLAGIKHLNRLEQVLARAEWDDERILEGLMRDEEGFLVEGVMSNVFLVQGGRLLTPLIDRCGVAGVMRALVMELARQAGLAVEETRILPRQAWEAEELFLTNSVNGIWPVCGLEEKPFEPGAITRMLSRRLEALIGSELETRCEG
ncbi:MAG: aminodeoxychorismate lyase [Methylococcaceae bacterium]|nr:aminodeoxychorismate lyase [Methylococcaceae bacterium]